MGHCSLTILLPSVRLHCTCVYEWCGSMQHSKAEVNMNAYTILMCHLTLEPLAGKPDNVTVAHYNKGYLENARVVIAELTTSNLCLLAIGVRLVVCVCVCENLCGMFKILMCMSVYYCELVWNYVCVSSQSMSRNAQTRSQLSSIYYNLLRFTRAFEMYYCLWE